MAGGDARLSVIVVPDSVVPDSGTGELTWPSGSMAITVEGGQHRCELEHRLP